MEYLKSKSPVISVIVILVVTLFSLTNYKAPTFAVPEAEAATVSPITLPDKVDTPVKEAIAPAGSKTIAKLADTGAEYHDGIYYGTGTGFRGKIRVSVVIRNGKIASITVLSSNDDPSYFNKAKLLLKSIIKKQTTNVDTVSGATYSSVGLINAVRNALGKASKSKTKATVVQSENATTDGQSTVAKGEAGQFPYPDGVYYGSADGFSSVIVVAVTIKDKTIRDISVVSQDDDEEYFAKALQVIRNIVKGQTTKVDTVSGATYSSNGLKGAVMNALKKAAAAEQSQEEADTDSPKNGDSDSENSGKENQGDSNTTPQSGEGDTGEEQNSSSGGTSVEPGDDDSGENEVESPYQDGTYFVKVKCNADTQYEFDDYTMYMDVTIKDGKITSITDVSGDGDAKNNSYIKIVINRLIPKITSSGSPAGVDAVSGATCSSIAVLEGCKEALKMATK